MWLNPMWNFNASEADERMRNTMVLSPRERAILRAHGTSPDQGQKAGEAKKKKRSSPGGSGDGEKKRAKKKRGRRARQDGARARR